MKEFEQIDARWAEFHLYESEMTLRTAKDSGPRVRRCVLKSVSLPLTRFMALVKHVPSEGLSFPICQTRMCVPRVIRSEAHPSLTYIYGINNLTKHMLGIVGNGGWAASLKVIINS